tara:strand:+ start:2097 stop:3398 length:1302 start_codon:yes stop_codon:yes gene_type:complete
MKRVLIIAYGWPPAGGIGVLRCLKFAKYLREFGWEPVVLTVKNPTYQFLDYENQKDVPDGIEMHYVPFWEPTSLFKVVSGRKKKESLQNIVTNSGKKRSIIDKLGMWVRGNFFIPDARKNWIKPSVKYLNEYLKSNQVDAILTDGPPHTNTVIGMRIAQQHNIPWLSDFQDPWTQIDYYSDLYIGKRADRIHKKLEQEVFKTAKKITIASPSWKVDLESIGAKNVDVIYYGYDEDDFNGFKELEKPKFKIFHAGLLGSDRNPSDFLEIIKELIEEEPELRSIIEIVLAGEVDYEVKQVIESNNLADITEYTGMIPRSQVFNHYQDSSLLLLPINQAENAQGRMPGKLYEYLRSKVSILVFGPEVSDVKTIVENKKLGKSFNYSGNKEGMKEYVQSILEAYRNKHDINLNVDVSEFSNKNQTKIIAQYLDEISK